MQVYCVGDPAGDQRSQADETTCFDILRLHGFQCEAAPCGNKFLPRRESVSYYLTKMTDGEPGFLLSQRCKVLRKGFMSGYHYRRMQISGTDRFAEAPEKNAFSHPHDALQYLCSFFKTARMSQVELNQFGEPGDGIEIPTMSSVSLDKWA